MRRLYLFALFIGLLPALPLSAHHAGEYFQTGDIVVSHAWTHENAEMAQANAIFLTISNEGKEADRLIGIEGDFFRQAVIQTSVLEEGVLRSRELAAVEIAPGQKLTFQPGGAQIVLDGLNQSFFAGDHFELTLVFEKAGSLSVEVAVEALDKIPGKGGEPSS